MYYCTFIYTYDDRNKVYMYFDDYKISRVTRLHVRKEVTIPSMPVVNRHLRSQLQDTSP